MSGGIDLRSWRSWGSILRQFGAWLFVYSLVLPPLLILVLMQSMQEWPGGTLVIVLNVVLCLVGLVVYCIGTVSERWSENSSRHARNAMRVG